MEFKPMIWSVIIFSMVIVAVGIMINDTAPNYGSTLTSDLGSYDKLDEISSSTETQQGSINPQSGEASSDYEAETFRGGYGIITNIFSPLRVVFGENGIFQSASERFGVPRYILIGLTTMFSVTIIFSIVAIVFKLSRSSA